MLQMGPNQTGEPPKNWRQERQLILYNYSCKSGEKKDRTDNTLVTQFILNSNSCNTESQLFFRRYLNKISQFWPDSTISVAWFHYLCNQPIIGKSTISFKLEREGNPAVNVKEILQSCVTGKQWCADLSKQWLTQPTHMMNQQHITRNARHFQTKNDMVKLG